MREASSLINKGDCPDNSSPYARPKSLSGARFLERSCESKCLLMNCPWKTNRWIRKKSGQQSRTLILTNGIRLRMVRFNVSRSLSVVFTSAMSVSQAAEGDEAFTLVGSVK